MVTQAADTVFMLAPQGAVAQAADIAVIIIATAVLALLLATLVLFRRLSALASRATDQVAPTLERVRAISEHVEYVSLAVRKDISRVNELVGTVTEKVEDASHRMEERIAEFNALMEVVQGEAEQVFIGTAATVRGVRKGASALAHPAEEWEDDGPEMVEDREDPAPADRGEPLPHEPG